MLFSDEKSLIRLHFPISEYSQAGCFDHNLWVLIRKARTVMRCAEENTFQNRGTSSFIIR